MELQTNKQVHYFERKENFYISGYEYCPYALVKIPIGNIEFHINKNIMEISCYSNPQNILLNKKNITKDSLCIENGDVLSIASYEITFFENVIEITGEISGCEIKLIEESNATGEFEDYPYYKKSPRVIYRIPEEKISIKIPPKKKEFTKGGLAQLIVPVLSTTAFTVAMGILLKRGAYVYMSVGMTIITLIFSIKNFISQRNEMKEQNRKRDEVYTEYLLETRKNIRKKRKEEKEALEYQFPNSLKIEKMISCYSSRLYEKSLTDDDFLQVNLGYYQGASNIQVEYASKDFDIEKDLLSEKAKEIVVEYDEIENVPLPVDLKKAHLGLVGSKRNIHEQLKYLMLQLTFFQSYHDLQILFIYNGMYKEEFEYMRWYPHLKIHAINVTGEINSAQARDQILGSVQQILKDRKQKLNEKKQETVFSPHFLFIIDEPKMVLNHAIMEYLQSKELNLGFSIIYTVDQQANLPENIGTVCILENSRDGKLLLKEGERMNRRFKIQNVNNINLEKMARHLSAIIHEQGVSSKIPENITFFDMYKIEHPEELHVLERWNKNQSHKSLAVPLGLRAEDDIVDLNLHEKAHGPHGLVAGTTGSGKSEIVQSYILSLAVNFHPHEVGFLLIDYKGGGMANLFAKLPHLLGTITNLDKSESMRAMESIKSELSRRQRIFSKNNVNHINGYNKLFKLGKVKEPLPHLFLISDEFAELKKEQPDFMSELVSAARIGRSLGIHLILATQKPSGVVDEQIWTNSKFRLCLKVQNEGDSKEMLKTPDAANITQAGRAYLQVGNNEIYELFQSAWSGATYSGEQTEEEKEDDRVWFVNSLGQGELINRDLSGTEEINQIRDTQLDVIVKHLHQVYKDNPCVEVKKPWLPPLACPIESPHTKDVRDTANCNYGDYTLGIGLVDIPEEQIQEEYKLDLIKNGHLLYMASSGYGKSMFLTNIILGLSIKNSVKNLNFYILDLGNSALIPLKGLPHVADYMGLDDGEKVQKFQKLILEEMSDRKRKFAKAMAQNISVYNETQEDKLKIIVVIIDNYDTIKELGDSMDSFIQKVARDGSGLGIYMITTMTRVNAMRSSVMNNFKEKIAGYNFDESENRSLIGRSNNVIPEEKKGRALVKRDNINLMQVYTPVPCENELIYIENLKKLINNIANASTESRAKGIPVLPEELLYNQLQDYPGYEKLLTKVPVGIDVENLNVQYLDLKNEPGLIIGTSGMGRTNTIRNIMRHILGYKIYLFDAKNGKLRDYEGIDGITYAWSEENILGALEAIRTETHKRKVAYAEQCGTKLSLKEYGQILEPIFVIVDIVQELYERIGEKAEILDILEEAQLCGIYVVVSADTKIRARTSSFLNTLTNSKTGIVVGSIKEQTIFPSSGIREENRNVTIGYIHLRGVNQKIKLVQDVN